jgi:23S rRNA (uracil1939-C5)-methyltransferase
MQKHFVGEALEGVVADVGAEGEGIVKDGAYPIFVPFAIKGERVGFTLTSVKKNYAYATLNEVLSSSNDRIKPRCPYFGKCGGCDLQHIDYAAQTQLKRAALERTLKKVGAIDVVVPPLITGGEWEYRNKLAMPFGFNKKSGRRFLGFYAKKSHDVVSVKWCSLHAEWAAKLIETVNGWLNDEQISVYDENTRSGVMRHMVARMLDTLSVVFVVNGDAIPCLKTLSARLTQAFGEVSVYVSVNRADTNVIFGDSAELVFGRETPQNLGAVKAVISPVSFLQVNNVVRDKLYDTVSRCLDNFDGEIIELYSGVGLLTAQLAARLEKCRITSVEIVPEAVADAKALMKALAFENRVDCLLSDAVKYMNDLRASETETKLDCNRFTNDGFDKSYGKGCFSNIGAAYANAQLCRLPKQEPSPKVSSASARDLTTGNVCAGALENRRALILDPPRKGCDERLLQASKSAAFERIIYISCNPATLARDLKILISPDSNDSSEQLPEASPSYRIEYIQAFDMFPQTSHVETLVCLARK